MGFENARDSFNDLREMSRRPTAQTNNNNNKNGGEKRTSFLFRKKAHGGGGGLRGASDSLNDLRRINYRKGVPPTPGWNYGYEPSDRHDEGSANGEDNWPIFEMTAAVEGENNNVRRDNRSASAVSSGAGNEHYISANGGAMAAPSTPPIIDCERICTVPEVFDELRSIRTSKHLSSLVLRDVPPPSSSSALEPCQSILHCLTPWKQNAQSSHHYDAFKEPQPLSQDKVNPIARTSVAVELYSGMPPSIRRSFAPSMFKVRFNVGVNTRHDTNDESNYEQMASLVGYDHRYVYSLGRDSIKNAGTTASSSPAPSIDKRKYRVHFSEIKRVLKVRKFTRDEALDVWFQRDDFDHFKAEMTLLIQEVEASRELAEVWLDAKSSSVVNDASDPKNHCGEAGGNPSSDGTSSAASAQHGGGTNENDHHHHQRSMSRGKARAWWHNYDHSRRGLERYASPGQARQILASYKVAVQKVLGEQRRQRILGFFCVPNAYDPEKIAEVYHEYTAWSRDLALAAGASDADAVSTNFDDDKRHTREYYVLKQVIASGYKVHKHMPQFMLPRCITPTGYLNEAASLYHGNGKDAKAADTRRSSWQLLRRTSSTGEEARENMSRVHKSDLMGPVAPSLAPSLQQVKEAGKDVHLSVGKCGVHHHSMAEKAKNFPFQQ
ncbi:hypothetical protein ACHAXM_011448 [Skeletonema potamos]